MQGVWTQRISSIIFLCAIIRKLHKNYLNYGRVSVVSEADANFVILTEHTLCIACLDSLLRIEVIM